MRNFINLFESQAPSDDALLELIPEKFRGSIKIEELRAALDHLMTGHSLDGVRNHYPRDIEDAMDDLETALDRLERAFDTSTIAIYRSINAENIDFSEPRRVGIYWTHNPNFTMGDSGLEDSRYITMEGSVHPDAIDWSETIPLTIDGVEDEIRLTPGARIERFSVDIDGPVSSIQFA